MSSSVFGKKNTPNNKRRAPTASNADLTATGTSPPVRAKRSLSERFRNLFRRDPSSKNRARSNDKRRGSPTRTTTNTISESPQLRTPKVNWSLGKKKTPTKTNSTKITTQPLPPFEISAPIINTNVNNYRTDIQGEHFVPRSPQTTYDSIEILHPSAANSMRTPTTTRPNRQVNLSDPDVFRPPSYLSDRSRSPSMNYRTGTDTENDYYFYNERHIASSSSMPLSDLEVLPMSQQRRVDGTTSYSTNEYMSNKPPTFPQTTTTSSSRPPSVAPMGNTPTQRKTTSSSTLNNVEMRSTTSLAREPEVPKLVAPTISLGSISSKKKDKNKKPKKGKDEMVTSTSTIGNLVEQNPLSKTNSWTNTYGSLPDAELIYGGSTTSVPPSSKTPKPSRNEKYPYISAIVAHHLRPESGRYQGAPQPPRNTYTTTSTDTNTNYQRPARFETSTTTLDDDDQHRYWSEHKSQSTSNIHHDGHIRPLTPDQTPYPRDVGVIRVGLNISTGQPHLHGSESPTIYRSSTTIYTRDKNYHVDRGEIRTWTSQAQNETTNTDSGTHKFVNGGTKPYVEYEVTRKPDQTVPIKVVPQPPPPEVHRYSPKPEKPKEKYIDEEEEQVHEERYEISYQYERQIEEYSYQTRPLPDETYQNNRYSYESDSRKTQHLQDQTHQYNSQSYIASNNISDHQRVQESSSRNTPVSGLGERMNTYRLRRSSDYDGLGITIASDAKTRTHHFIRDVEIDSPAYRAGIRQMDRIVNVNNINVENMDFSDVLVLLKEGLDNDNLHLSVVHELDSV